MKKVRYRSMEGWLLKQHDEKVGPLFTTPEAKSKNEFTHLSTKNENLNQERNKIPKSLNNQITEKNQLRVFQKN